ncbi:hypothetical protein J7I93_01215 [Bacillus sp. ISL-47]|nr:hypothetical protein [Bacillus sp. ISL-47]MBT2706853.1 hypothetical protein [Pseudomonas sp. ISL-84]
MLDGIYSEKLGIPSAAICTDKFMVQGTTAAQVQGFKDYSIVEVFHPIATALPAALKTEAQRITGEVLAVLTKE